jgi:hypothetical protein
VTSSVDPRLVDPQRTVQLGNGNVRLILLGLLALVTALGVYLAILLIGPFDFPWQRVIATIVLEPPVVGKTTVRITGSTSLPDGSLIDYHYWRGDAINEGPAGVAEVKDGGFSVEDDISTLRPGKWTVELSFSAAWGSEQPSHVMDLFGSEGEHLAGPQVYVDSPGDPKQLLVTTDVDIPSARPDGPSPRS